MKKAFKHIHNERAEFDEAHWEAALPLLEARNTNKKRRGIPWWYYGIGAALLLFIASYAGYRYYLNQDSSSTAPSTYVAQKSNAGEVTDLERADLSSKVQSSHENDGERTMGLQVGSAEPSNTLHDKIHHSRDHKNGQQRMELDTDETIIHHVSSAHAGTTPPSITKPLHTTSNAIEPASNDDLVDSGQAQSSQRTTLASSLPDQSNTDHPSIERSVALQRSVDPAPINNLVAKDITSSIYPLHKHPITANRGEFKPGAKETISQDIATVTTLARLPITSLKLTRPDMALRPPSTDQVIVTKGVGKQSRIDLLAGNHYGISSHHFQGVHIGARILWPILKDALAISVQPTVRYSTGQFADHQELAIEKTNTLTTNIFAHHNQVRNIYTTELSAGIIKPIGKWSIGLQGTLGYLLTMQGYRNRVGYSTELAYSNRINSSQELAGFDPVHHQSRFETLDMKYLDNVYYSAGMTVSYDLSRRIGFSLAVARVIGGIGRFEDSDVASSAKHLLGTNHPYQFAANIHYRL